MLQNLIIIKDGSTLFNESFGDCHQLTSNPLLLSGFFEALLSFADEFEQGKLEYITFQNAQVYFITKKRIIFVAIFDKKDRISTVKKNMKIITSEFFNQFHINLTKFNGNINVFYDFRKKLLDLEVTEIDCSPSSNCKECTTKKQKNAIVDEITTIANKLDN
jgi:hypothetical protein